MAEPNWVQERADEERITREALALPEHQRVRLAQRLWATLPGYVPADLGPEQLEELLRRIDEVERGDAEVIPYEEVERILREKYDL